MRVVASAPGYTQAALRRRVVIPEGPEDCTANLIDEGVVIDGSNVTVYFQGVGPVKEFLCIMDRERKFPCEILMLRFYDSMLNLVAMLTQV